MTRAVSYDLCAIENSVSESSMNVLYLVCYENGTPDAHRQFPGRFSYAEEIRLSYELVKMSLPCAALSRPAFSSLFSQFVRFLIEKTLQCMLYSIFYIFQS